MYHIIKLIHLRRKSVLEILQPQSKYTWSQWKVLVKERNAQMD